MKRLVATTRELMPDVGIQIPPNLSDWWDELVEAGATDLGGLSANGDHISPEHAFPSPHQVRKRLAPRGYALTERLCAYSQYLDPEWMEQGVLDAVKLKYWSFIPRRGSGRRDGARDRPRRWRRARSSAAAPARRSTEDELTALFAERRPEVIEDMRVAADELRAELNGDTATFVVNRNINFTNVCIVGCAFCGFGQGKRSPDAYHVEVDDFQARIAEAVGIGATEICMQGGIHPDYTLADYGRWLQLAKEAAPADPPARLLADGGPLHVRALRAQPRRASSSTCASAGSARPREPRPRSSTTASAGGSRRTSSRPTAGSRSSRPAIARGCARPRP